MANDLTVPTRSVASTVCQSAAWASAVTGAIVVTNSSGAGWPSFQRFSNFQLA